MDTWCRYSRVKAGVERTCKRPVHNGAANYTGDSVRDQDTVDFDSNEQFMVHLALCAKPLEQAEPKHSCSVAIQVTN